MNAVRIEALLALELFQLDPRSKKSRTVLHQHLVDVALLELDSPANEAQILAIIVQMCGERCPLTEKELHQTLERSVKHLDVSANSDGTYSLSPLTREALEGQRQKHQNQERSFNRLIVSQTEKSVKQTLSTLAEPMLVSAVTKTLQSLFYDNHLRLQKALQKGAELRVLLESDFDPEQYLRSELEVFVKTHLPDQMEATVTGIKRALSNLQVDDQAYLLRLLQQIFFFEILNLDPRLQDLERRCFEQTKLYLDTNVVIRYLSLHHPDHNAITATVETSKALGCNIFVSPATLGEMIRLVISAQSHSVSLIQNKISYVLRSDPRAADNPLIETFVSEKRGNPALTWPAFIARYDDVKLLLLAHDILVEGDDVTVLQADMNYTAVSSAVSTVKQFANTSIILHDTLNVVLVHKLRQKVSPTPMGPGVWLLTIDHGLPKVDRTLRHQFPVGHCQMVDKWAEAVFPFQGIAGISFNGDYVAFLVGNRFGVYFDQSVVDTNFLKTMVDDEIGFPELLELPPEVVLGVIRAMQNNREARSLVEESAEATGDNRERQRKQLVDLMAKYAADIEAESKVRAVEEIKLLKDGIANLLITLDEAKRQSGQNTTLIANLGDKIGLLGTTLQEKEDALTEKEAVLAETQRQLEAERQGSWLARVIRAMRGR